MCTPCLSPMDNSPSLKLTLYRPDLLFKLFPLVPQYLLSFHNHLRMLSIQLDYLWGKIRLKFSNPSQLLFALSDQISVLLVSLCPFHLVLKYLGFEFCWWLVFVWWPSSVVIGRRHDSLAGATIGFKCALGVRMGFSLRDVLFWDWNSIVSFHHANTAEFVRL